jgi:two-component system, chemotaxis family, chemotaxis protein CheY
LTYDALGCPEVAGSPDGKEDPEMKRCLFVDDSSVIRKVAKRILGGSDMMVIEAATGLDAIEMCAADMPDVIVVDGALPDIQAVDLIRRIRAMEGAAKPQILISLVEVDVASIMRAKRAGAQGYLLKPFNRPQLLERFRVLKIAA